MPEYVSRNAVASLYDGTNSADVLATAQRSNTNEWTIQNEEAGVLILRESSGYLWADWVLDTGKVLLVVPEESIQILTEAQFNSAWRYTKTLFLAAAADPDVLQALKEALETLA
jgi:hypothetical protein